MNRHSRFPIAACLLVFSLALTELLPAAAAARLSTRFIARGEQGVLEIAASGVQPADFPLIPETTGFEIESGGRGVDTRILPGRVLEYVFSYQVSSYQVGRHRIPPFEVHAGGTRYRTEPVDFVVFDPDELVWAEANVGGLNFRYASSFLALNPTPYLGETTPVEIKLYVPGDLFIDDWGIPDFERDGLSAWRFQPAEAKGGLNLLGRPHTAISYPSTLTPTRTGTVAIGPARVRLIVIQSVMDGFLRRVAREVYLDIPRLELEARPLPAGAPEGFENAVGDFRIRVQTEVTELKEGDPVPVEIVVEGSGNLDVLRPPAPIDTDGWKVYEATTEPRGAERSELSGRTVFRQFMRPLEIKAALPPYRLVFFDPATSDYRTITSDPIPLRVKPAPAPAADMIAATPPQAGALPVERMTDILGILQPASLTLPAGGALPAWAWHLPAGLLAALLAIKALWMRHSHRFHRDPVRTARLLQLAEVRKTDPSAKDDATFLLAAGRFIERWHGTSTDPEIHTILTERDANCFRPDDAPPPRLASGRRAEILRVLRKASLLWLAAALWLAAPATARADLTTDLTADLATRAAGAFEAARYDEAIRLWLSAGPYQALTADTLYNIGNACFRAGSPGQAALYYRRALSRDPTHAEARQNLRFLERKHGSITINRPEYQYALARIPLATWQGMVWTGGWLGLLALLVFPATHHGSRLRPVAIGTLILAPFLAVAGGIGWRYFPNDAEFAPLERQAVIVLEDAVLHADASRTSPEVIDAPPGSLLEIIRQSGRWSYVAFASKTRGWIPTDAIETILPKSQPTPPDIRKPKADDKSA